MVGGVVNSKWGYKSMVRCMSRFLPLMFFIEYRSLVSRKDYIVCQAFSDIFPRDNFISFIGSAGSLLYFLIFFILLYSVDVLN